MTTGDMYDEFFGDGFWERSYKSHIVAFADRCIAASKRMEVAPSASPNSDYATALRIYKEWGDSDDISSHDGFFVWCKERLNASTHIA
jgi:hypothetical protein